MTGSNQESPPTLREAGQRVERALKGGEEHRYQISLANGAYLNLTLDYQGLSADGALHGPTGQPVIERRGGTDTVGGVEIALIASVSGNYQFVVRGRGAATNTGRYNMEVKALRPAVEMDRQYTMAHRMAEEGNALLILRTAESRRQALAKFREALPLWQALGNFDQEFETLRLISDTHYVLGEFRSGLEAAREMLTKARASRQPKRELKALKYVGLMHNSLNEFTASRQILEQALLLSRELQERQEERAILNGLGIAVAALGQRHTAIGYYQEALKIAREIGDRSGEATMLRNLALRYEGIGEPDQALAHYQQALALRRELGIRDTEALTLLDISRMQLRMGEFQSSLDLAKESLTRLRAAGRRNDEASALEQLSRAYFEMREFDLALESVNQALAIYRSGENRKQEANCLRTLGSIQRALGNKAEAQTVLQQALALHRSLKTPNDLMSGLLHLGIESIEQGNPRQALIHLEESLAISRTTNSPQGEALASLQASRAHYALGETDQARELLQQALRLSQTIKHRLLEAEIEHDLARLALRQGQYHEAQKQIEAALNIIENSRESLVDPSTRADHRGGKQDYYEVYIETLIRRHTQEGDGKLAALALEAAERGRARTLLDLLTEARIEIRQGVNPELLDNERILRQRLLAKAELLQRFSASKSTQEQAKAMETDIARLTTQWREAESRLRAASPAYAALTQPQPLTLPEIQRDVLDGKTLLLEYALGTERSYLFAVTDKTLKVFTLPKRADLEEAARRLHARLSRRGQAPAFSSLAAGQQWMAKLEQDTATAAADLSRLILQPVAAELADKRLLIVPDGVLHYVPFAALPEVVTKRQGDKVTGRTSFAPSPLVVNHELLTLPSASTLAVLRRELADRTAAPKTLAVLADPVFSATDERVRNQDGKALASARVPAIASQAARASQVFDPASSQNFIPRLPASRTEAETILALAPAAGRKAALDFAANPATVRSAELGQYRYVHFATHSVLNPAHPELSGLWLSLVDEAGKPQPGFLNTQEIFQLKLPAELVVLSGCQTALGREVNGEGLIGLTRGFMYAGARRVIASLWQVNDDATAELMKGMYQEMLGNPASRQARNPAAALRAAQIRLWRTPRWRSPYYWAGFVLQGEW